MWNARNIAAQGGLKIEEIALTAHKYRPEIIPICESHLNESFEDGEIEIPLYRVIRADRDKARSRPVFITFSLSTQHRLIFLPLILLSDK